MGFATVRHLLLLAVAATLVCVASVLRAAELRLVVENRGDAASSYYHELIEAALAAAGHRVTLEKVPADVPLTRQIAMFEAEVLDLVWFLQTPERDRTYVPVGVDLTNGLIGQRVLLVRKGASADYAAVRDLAGFRALGKVGGLGKDWFDASVWEANGLPYEPESGDWRTIYAKVAAGNRGVDYFSRGVVEILAEAAEHPELEIEPRLLLIYDRDFRFYLSRRAAAAQPVLAEALRAAQRSGLIDQLVREHYVEAIRALDVPRRTRIHLVTPK